MSSILEDLSEFPSLRHLVGQLLRAWPEHEKFLTKRFHECEQEELPYAEKMSAVIAKIIGQDMSSQCLDYKWTCELLLKEELYFRRNNSYRLSKFEDALAEIYDRDSVMTRYLNGLLLSHVLWRNQSRCIQFYIENFLAKSPPDYSVLEIGPGHGLYLYFAADDNNCSSVTGWDISPTSLRLTQHSLAKTGLSKDIVLQQRDAMSSHGADDRFDCVVISEVLEHLEHPESVLGNIRRLLRPDGRLFVNVPVNSPAPDHIYLWRTPEEVVEMVAKQGFEIESASYFPVTGYTEKSARDRAVTISTALIARLAD